MKYVMILLTSVVLISCKAKSELGKWNDSDREEAKKDVEKFSSALGTVGSAKDLCYDCYIDSLEKLYVDYASSKRLNDGDRTNILLNCAIRYMHYDE